MEPVAPDGSPVELYALLPEQGEGEIVARAVPAGGSNLELGCGTGRMTRQLVRLGFRVTAVDESAEMLARVEGAETVRARIEELELGRRFDAVLLASNLITVEPERRRAFLETCRRHADLVVVEGLPLGWAPEDGEMRLGEVVSRLRIERVDDGVVHGTMEYEGAGRSWRHAFGMRAFADSAELEAALAEAGLRFGEWLDGEGGRWFTARATS
ncbi:MAG: class I SAM-dependent methyltransferase [Gaiellaceae bacterium]